MHKNYRQSALVAVSDLPHPMSKVSNNLGGADEVTDIWTSLHAVQDGICEGIVAEISYEVLCPR